MALAAAGPLCCCCCCCSSTLTVDAVVVVVIADLLSEKPGAVSMYPEAVAYGAQKL